ncbi:MAG: PQQ-binding-like beta-propeller repeat protein, partial [Myxococcales bacterium]|nr:PQQ-binding-like beta-propeller repeat protein [Myxococcales bacterium]
MVPLLIGLATATARLLSGRRRALVELLESPLEMAIERAGSVAWVSLYETNAPGCVAIDRAAIPLHALREEIVCLLQRAAAGASDVGLVDLAGELGAWEETLRSAPTSTQPAPPIAVASLTVETRVDACALTTTLDPASVGLQSAEADLRLDRHALLARGRTFLSDDSGRTLVLSGRPLRVLEAWVDALVASWSGGEGEALDDLALDIAASPPAGHSPVSTLRTTRRGSAFEVETMPGDFVVPLTADVLFAALSDHVAGLCEALVRLAAPLAANELLAELRAAAGQLDALRPRATPTAPLPAREARAEVGAAPVAHSGRGYAASAIRLLRYEWSWTLQRAGMAPRTLEPVGGDGWIFAASRGVERVDAIDGTVVWSIGVSADARVACVPDVGAAIVTPRGGVALIDLASGERRWRAQRHGPPVVALALDAAHVALADHSGHLRVHATGDGAVRWERADVAIRPAGLALGGDAAVAARSDGTIVAADVHTGQELWRARASYERLSVRVFGDRVIALGDDPLRDSTFVGVLDLERGEWVSRRAHAAELRGLGWGSRGLAVVVADGRAARVEYVDAISGAAWAHPLRWDGHGERARCWLHGGTVVVAAPGSFSGLSSAGVAWEHLLPGGGDVVLARRSSGSG